ncbi:hypothetical protein HMPREF0880_03772 [Yokenella regensburgei ATCC 43003]|nr:hypothetical protein HMPREF0880_03772 [Yokenella regensburgei ATCC 43003]
MNSALKIRFLSTDFTSNLHKSITITWCYKNIYTMLIRSRLLDTICSHLLQMPENGLLKGVSLVEY